MIRTAIQFGYAFIALFLTAAFLGGIVAFILGWRFRSRVAKWSGLGIAVIVVAVVVSNVMFERSIEWNPTIKSDAEIIGIWSRDDWNLYLRGESYTNTMRFITFRERYRLMTHPPGDPDEWDGDLGLKQQESKQ
jgi:hypothetical protein